MGEMGVRWFRSCGYREERLFPFAYVTEPAAANEALRSPEKFAVLYVGQFIHRKGLDLLLSALARIGSTSMKVGLLGDGPDRTCLEELSDRLGIRSQVTWVPKCDSAAARVHMQTAEVFLLPSRHDGWGAVVNESLMAGTPVICSTASGASELIREPWLGSVFQSGSVESLANALRHWLGQGAHADAERERIRSWARCISGESVAHYFVAIMDHVYSGAPRPIAPWRNPAADLTSDVRPLSAEVSPGL